MYRRQADLRREPGEQEQVGDERRLAAAGVGRELLPGELADPAGGDSGREHHDPEQRDAEPERGQDEVLPARLERAWRAAEADE